MVTLGSKRLHVIFTDSRGRDLKHRLNKLNNTGEHFMIMVYEGATLQDLVEAVMEYLPRHLFDVIYMVGGACDITNKDKLTGKITFDWKPGKDLKIQLVGCLLHADEEFKRIFPASKIVYCTLIGVELQRVVTSQVISQENQNLANEAVWEFNTAVFDLNSRNNVFSPSLHHQVHRCCKGKKRNYYHHLADGIHLSEFLKEKWANQFINAIAHN